MLAIFISVKVILTFLILYLELPKYRICFACNIQGVILLQTLLRVGFSKRFWWEFFDLSYTVNVNFNSYFIVQYFISLNIILFHVLSSYYLFTNSLVGHGSKFLTTPLKVNYAFFVLIISMVRIDKKKIKLPISPHPPPPFQTQTGINELRGR